VLTTLGYRRRRRACGPLLRARAPCRRCWPGSRAIATLLVTANRSRPARHRAGKRGSM